MTVSAIQADLHGTYLRRYVLPSTSLAPAPQLDFDTAGLLDLTACASAATADGTAAQGAPQPRCSFCRCQQYGGAKLRARV